MVVVGGGVKLVVWILRELRNYLFYFQFKCKFWKCELTGEKSEEDSEIVCARMFKCLSSLHTLYDDVGMTSKC